MVLVNGVPRRGGGIRPPLNGTVMLSPDYRWMRAGEEFVIEPGTLARIRLPNGDSDRHSGELSQLNGLQAEACSMFSVETRGAMVATCTPVVGTTN